MNQKAMNNLATKYIKIAQRAILVQILFLVIGVIVSVGLGFPPETAEEAFEIYHKNPVLGLLQDDAYNIVLIIMYLFSMTGVFLMLENRFHPSAVFGFAGVVITVILMMAIYPGFSMMHLADKYYLAEDLVTKQQFITAGETLIASNMWNSSASFFSGILMQGGSLLMIIVMMKGSNFSKITILSGILCNGFDLANHLIHYNFPDIAKALLIIAGPFYLIWYIYMIKDFGKYIHKNQ